MGINLPDELGWQDKRKECTFRKWNERSCRLANGRRRLGVNYKDHFGVLAYNRGEWMDIYAGAAKGGQIAVPLMFRLAPPDVKYIANHAECRAFIVEKPFVEMIDGIKARLSIYDLFILQRAEALACHLTHYLSKVRLQGAALDTASG